MEGTERDEEILKRPGLNRSSFMNFLCKSSSCISNPANRTLPTFQRCSVSLPLFLGHCISPTVLPCFGLELDCLTLLSCVHLLCASH